jgi:UDP:flavonoid glycosyltransferase YjiC (YdhE family)
MDNRAARIANNLADLMEAERWRARAKECRDLIKEADTPETRKTLEELANTCGEIADLIECGKWWGQNPGEDEDS